MRQLAASLKSILLGIGFALVLTPRAMAHFDGPYSLTPPEPGQYIVMASSNGKFGNWSAVGMARFLEVDTRQAPAQLILDTQGVARGAGGFINVTAQASGPVHFTYRVEGFGPGEFRWWIGKTSGVITNLTAEPAEISATIAAGELVSFQVSATGRDSWDGSGSAQRRVTITGFEAPVAVPGIRLKQNGQSFRIAPGQSLTLRTEAAMVNASGELSFVWQANGTDIPAATNKQTVFDYNETQRTVSSLSVSGGAPGATNIYRVRAKAGTLETLSPPVQVVTVVPSEPRLLLHLEFEDTAGGHFTDSTGESRPSPTGVIPIAPGRVGQSAANFAGTGYLRIPAASTGLELVGDHYTIAFWIRPLTNRQSQQAVYNLESHDNHLSGWLQDGNWVAVDPAGYYASAGASISGYHRSDGAGPIDSNLSGAWQHCAFVYDGVTRKLYIDGTLRGTVASTTAPIGTGQDDLYIAPLLYQPGSEQALGLLDDFRVYNYALAPDQIAALASVPLPPPRLSIQAEGRFLKIIWPAANGRADVIEFATSMGPNALWAPVDKPVTSAGEYNEVTVTRAADASYYRLRGLSVPQ